jgi:hypothetical protein
MGPISVKIRSNGFIKVRGQIKPSPSLATTLLDGTGLRITHGHRRTVGQNRRCARCKQQEGDQANSDNRFFHLFLLYGDLGNFAELLGNPYCAEQGLGQHIGIGTESAEARVGA